MRLPSLEEYLLDYLFPIFGQHAIKIHFGIVSGSETYITAAQPHHKDKWETGRRKLNKCAFDANVHSSCTPPSGLLEIQHQIHVYTESRLLWKWLTISFEYWLTFHWEDSICFIWIPVSDLLRRTLRLYLDTGFLFTCTTVPNLFWYQNHLYLEANLQNIWITSLSLFERRFSKHFGNRRLISFRRQFSNAFENGYRRPKHSARWCSTHGGPSSGTLPEYFMGRRPVSKLTFADGSAWHIAMHREWGRWRKTAKALKRILEQTVEKMSLGQK